MMASWIKQQAGVVITLVVLFAGVVAGYSRLAAEQAALCKTVDRKADKEQVTRELDQIHFALQRIEGKIDDLRR